MKAKTGFFQDEQGNNSSVRLVFFVGMIWLMLISSAVLLYTLKTNKEQIIPVVAAIGAFFSTISAILS